MKYQPFNLFLILLLPWLTHGQQSVGDEFTDTKGAIIIAGLEGQVTVINNTTQVPLPPEKVVAGGVLFDGHTIKTGPSSKIILLLTNGTITTVKPNTSLNFKKFTQTNFDTSKIKLSDLKGEPSNSDTVIDIEFGDLVVDVKKLDKKSSFNIESPVGTAGIRGTVPAISVAKTPDGGFTQTTSMLRGEIAFTPVGGGLPTLLGPGQSLSTGIGPNGLVLPLQMGRVSTALLTSIQADVEAASAATGISYEDFKKGITPNNREGSEDAPSEDEINDSDDSRKGASKGVGGDDDNGSQEAVALEKAGLIDLDNANQVAQVETYVEVTGMASELFADKEKADEVAGRRRADGPNESSSFLTNIVGNLESVVEITETAESVGAKDASTLTAVVSNPDKAEDLKVVIQAASDVGSKDSSTLSAVLRNAESADKVASVVKLATAEELVSSPDGADSSSTASEKKGKKLLGMFKAVKKVDEVAQKKKAAQAEAAAAEAAALADAQAAQAAADAAAAAELAAELAAAQELLVAEAEKLRLQQESAALAEQLANASEEDKVALQAQADAAAKAANLAEEESKARAIADATAKLAKETAAAQAAQQAADAKTAYDLALITIETSSTAEGVDQVVAEFVQKHSALARRDLNLNSKALIRKSDIETPVVDASNVFTNLDAVSSLTATATALEETAKADAQAAGKSQEEIQAAGAAVSAGFDSVLQNADQANELKEMVDKSAEIAAAAAAAAAVEAAAAENAKLVAETAANAAAAELAAASSAEEMAAAQVKIDAADVAKAAAEQAKIAAESSASTKGASVSNLLNNASKAKDLKTVVDSAEGAGAGDSLTALLKNPDQADKFAEVVKSNQSAGDNVGGASKLSTLFDVVKKVDAAKDAQIVAAAASAAADAEKTRLDAESAALAQKLANASASEKAALEIQSAAADAAAAAAETAAAEKAAAAVQANSIKVSDAFDKIADVVDLAESATELAGGNENSNFLDNVLQNAEQAAELNAMVKKADEIAAAEAKVASDAKSAAEAAEAAADALLAQATTVEAIAAAEAAQAEAASAKVAAASKAAEAAASKTSRSGKLFANASQAADLKAMVDKNEELAATEKKAAVEAKAAAETAATAAAADLANATSAVEIEAAQAKVAEAALAATAAADAEAAAAANLSARSNKLMDNADKAKDMKLLAEKAEASQAADAAAAAAAKAAADQEKDRLAAEAAAIADQIANASASEMEALVAAKATADAAATAAIVVADAAAAAEAVQSSSVSSLGSLFDNAENASDVAAVVAAAELEKDRLAADKIRLDAESASLVEQLANASAGEKAELENQVIAAAAAALAAETAAVAAAAEALSSVGAVIANADQAKAMKAAVDAATATTGTGGDDTNSDQKLKTLFAVVKKVDDSKKSASSVPANGSEGESSQSSSAFENLQALVEVAETLSGSSDGSGEIDLGAGFDAVLLNADAAEQLASALKEDSSLVDKLNTAPASGEEGVPVLDLQAEVAKSALGNLESRFSENPEQVAAINQYKDRADDLAYVLNSASVKGNAEMEANFLNNLDKLDNLLDLTQVLEDDPAKIQTVFQNLDKSDDLKILTEQFRYEPEKLDTVFGQLEKVDDFKTLSATYSDDPEKLDAIFANTDKLDDIKSLSANLASNEMETVFANLDYLSEIQTISSRYEGEERTSVLENLNSLTRRFDDDPAKKEIIFGNPDKLSAIQTLTSNLDGEDGFDVIFSNIDKSDAILNTYNDIQELPLEQQGEYLSNLFKDQDSFENTMKEQGKLKLNLEYPAYGDAIEQFGDRAAEIAITAELFKGNDAELALLFSNLDSLDLIREADTLGAKGTDILQNIDDLKALKADGDVSPALQSQFLSNPSEVGEILDIKNEAMSLGADATDIFANLEDLKALKADADFTPEFELEFLKDPSKIGDALKVKDNAKALGANLDDVLKNIDDLVELNADFQGDPTKMATIFSNANKADELKRLNDQFGEQGDTLLANMDKLDEFEELVADFGGDPTKMATVFANPDKAEELKRLNDQFGDQADTFLGNLDKLDEFEELATDFGGDPTKMATVFANPDKAEELKRLNDQFGDQADTFLNNLDKLDEFEELVTDFGGDPTKMATVFANPDKAEELKRLNDQFGDQADTFLGNLDKLDEFEELATDFGGDPTKMATVFANPDKAEELKRLNDQFGDQADTFLNNLDKLDEFEELATDFGGDPTKMATVFANPEKADELKRLNDLHPGKEDLFLGNLDSLDILEGDSGYIDVLETDADFFKDVKDLDPAMQNLPPALLTELKQLGLSKEELGVVVADLLSGPSSTGPSSTAPVSDPSPQAAGLSLLQDHTFTGTIDTSFVMSMDQAFASAFFSDASDAYNALTALDQLGDSVTTSNRYVLGGRNLSFSSGNYQLANDLIIASTNKISLLGELVFGNLDDKELIFASAVSLEIQSGTSIKYNATSLGLGSFDSVNIINVDLFAEGELSVRSLDSIVINNSDMRTANNGGADFIHLLAANELTIDNLRFSEQVRKIAMDAMTINLSNINFPSGSTVELKSQYGGIDGKYPNFGSKLYGRVNFIENIRYNSNLINSQPTFDQFGSSISVGTLK